MSRLTNIDHVRLGNRSKAELCVFLFFFFQAEDGIRDYKVTGVQTCALPICLLVKGGGHAMAAGVTLRKTALAEFRAYLEEALSVAVAAARRVDALLIDEIGRASCRERG